MTTVMTAAADSATWTAHLQVLKFTALNVRDTMHQLHPRRARLVDAARKRGQLHRVPQRLIPRVEGDMMLRLGLVPFEVQDHPGNLLCNDGIDRLLSLLIGGGGQAYDSSHTAILIGDGTTAANADDSDMGAASGAAHRWCQIADGGYPAATSQVLMVQATVPVDQGNFADGVREWGITQNTTSGAVVAVAPLLNHKVAFFGVKSDETAWTLRAAVTIA